MDAARAAPRCGSAMCAAVAGETGARSPRPADREAAAARSSFAVARTIRTSRSTRSGVGRGPRRRAQARRADQEGNRFWFSSARRRGCPRIRRDVFEPKRAPPPTAPGVLRAGRGGGAYHARTATSRRARGGLRPRPRTTPSRVAAAGTTDARTGEAGADAARANVGQSRALATAQFAEERRRARASATSSTGCACGCGRRPPYSAGARVAAPPPSASRAWPPAPPLAASPSDGGSGRRAGRSARRRGGECPRQRERLARVPRRRVRARRGAARLRALPRRHRARLFEPDAAPVARARRRRRARRARAGRLVRVRRDERHGAAPAGDGVPRRSPCARARCAPGRHRERGVRPQKRHAGARGAAPRRGVPGLPRAAARDGARRHGHRRRRDGGGASRRCSC